MRKTMALLFPLLAGFSVLAQNANSDCKITEVNKTVRDIACTNAGASPLNNYVVRMSCWMDGTVDSAQSAIIPRDLHPKPYGAKGREAIQNSIITHVITWHDSVGFVFRKERSDSRYYLVGQAQLEDGKWQGIGEDLCSAKNEEEMCRYVAHKAPSILGMMRQYIRQKNVSTDTLAFVSYLKQHGQNPQAYLLEKIAKYPLVIYGEFHRRKISWDFMRSVVRQPEFIDRCGTVFLELASDNQLLLDRFLRQKTMDTMLIYKVLQDEYETGWADRGMYEFICEIWKINHRSSKKITLVAPDYKVCWDSIRSYEDYRAANRKLSERDSIMADGITRYMKGKADSRNALFIVGDWHARKAASKPPISVATRLTKAGGALTPFSIKSHSMIGDNQRWLGMLRGGLFDYAFRRNGNRPVAFDLAKSPFGREPFDAMNSYEYGNYADFYDGYIFLCALEDEPYWYDLKGLFTPAFVDEMKRRAALARHSDIWGVPLDSITSEKMQRMMDEEVRNSGNRRFREFFE